MPDGTSGRVAVVTGAARGIGKNVARALARSGAHVVVVDRDADGGAETVAQIARGGLSATFVGADLAVKGGPQRAVREAFERLGRVDILVNNARSGRRVTVFEETEDTWDETFAVTLRAAFFASQEALRIMPQNGGGSIVNVGSIASRVVTQESAAYQAAKGAIGQLTRFLAVKGGPLGVRTNAVVPGFIVQDEHLERFEGEENRSWRKTADAVHPTGRTGRSDDVAEAVLFLSSPRAAFVNGHEFVLDGGSTLREQFDLARSFGP